MRRLLLVFLSFRLLFAECLLSDQDFEIDEREECDHNAFEFVRMSTKDDPKKSSVEEPNLALVTLEAPMASMVAGCVSAISGSFVDSHIGLVVPGAIPLTVQCTYCSSEKKWTFQHKPKLRASLSGGGNHINIHYIDDQGSGIPFCGSSSKDATSFIIPYPVFDKGVTNCGSGELSGRTNLKNNNVHFVRDEKDEHEKYYLFRTGSHRERLFSYLEGGERHRKGAPLGKFLLKEETLPNGNKIKYNYNSMDQLAKISAEGGEKAFGSLQVESGSSLPNNWKTSWKATSGNVSYTFDHNQKMIQGIFPTNAMSVSYTYNSEGRVESKNLPDNRYLKISYYDCDDSWHRKPVHKLFAPVGDNNECVCTHTFFYYKGADHRITTVQDAVGNMTTYSYGDSNKRLYSIEKLEGSKPYSEERFFWSAVGNLKAKYFQGGDKIYFCRTYEYDHFGNVTQERLWGNLTGHIINPIHVTDEGVPLSLCEVFTKTRTFTDDGWNLLLTEDDGRKTISCTYYDKSNLLKSRFTYAGPVPIIYVEKEEKKNKYKRKPPKLVPTQDFSNLKVLKREFFEYSYGALVKEIWDDGSGFEQNDTTDVTERHERRTILNAIGLPEIISEYCNDHLVKRQINTYSPQGLLTQQKHYGSDEILAYTLRWEYDALGNVTTEVNALGEESRFTYDANGNKTYEESPYQELCKKYTYDYANRLTKAEEIWKDGRHFITNHRYNTLNQRISTIDAYGNETFYFYDILGRLIEKRLPAIYDENGKLVTPIEKIEYDPMGNIVAKWDPIGNCIKRKCTIRGKPYRIDYPDGSHEEKYYTLEGLLESEVEKNGIRKNYTYDSLGRITKTETKNKKGKVLKTTTANYNTFHLLSETDELGLTTHYTYDWAGRQASMTRGDHVKHYTYDALGRNEKTLEVIDPTHVRETNKTYDLLNRIVEERIEDGKILQMTQYCYDIHGNRTHLTTYTHAGQAIAITAYLPNGEPLSITDPLGNVTHIDNNYAFPHQGQCVRCTTTTDPMGNQEIKIFDTHQRIGSRHCCNSMGEKIQSETYTYDLLGHKIASHNTVYFPGENPHTIIMEWMYDCMGNITSCIEAKDSKDQKTTCYKYNLFGQKVLTELPNGITITYTYDDLGLLKTYSSSDGTISYSYAYDLKDHPVSIEDHVQKTVSNRLYDIYGRLISETLDNGYTLAIKYDALDRPTSITLPDQTTIHYQYNALYLTAVKRGDYTHFYEDYDLAGNVSKEQLTGQAGTIQYIYDLLQRPISTASPHRQETLTNFDNAGNLLNRQVQSQETHDYTYTYDDLYQLISETGPKTHSYSNDSLYNRRSKDNQIYTINDLNQLLHQTEWDYTYDANGNLILKYNAQEKIHYRYDALDRLIEVKSALDTTTYTYDSFHRRLSKTTNGNTTSFLYHGQNEIGAMTGGKIQQLRVLGASYGAEIGSSVLFELQDQVYIPLHDSLGNVAALLDLQGNLIETYDYSAFGEMAFTAPTSPWLFSSKRLDPETGFFFFGRRYYAPDIGRWITPDPLGFEDGPNLYTYAHNRPLVFIDPDGQFAFLAPLAYFAATTALGLAAEAALPYAAAYCGESAAGIACAAFLTGVVKGYNGSVFEPNTFDGAGPVPSLLETTGKGLGTVLGCMNPRGAANMGTKVVTNVASKELLIMGEKMLAHETLHIFSTGAKGTVRETAKKTAAFAEIQLGKKQCPWIFPENPNALLKELPRNSKGHIFPCENLRIRPEKHAFDPGDIFNPRHHNQHYHVDILKKGGSWNNPNHVRKIKPNGYSSGDGTGFLPGEFFPGVDL